MATIEGQVPTVSVVIPVHVSRYLRAAVDSVLAQTFDDYEIIVIDDGSPDPPEIEGWPAVTRKRLHYIRQHNQGPAAARNTGIRAARGVFVAFLDADDTWEPTYLEEQLAALGQDGGTELVYCSALMIGQPEADRRTLMESTSPRGLVSCTSLLREEVAVFLSGVVAGREAILRAGLFDERFVHGEDFDLWLRMLKTGARMGFQPRVLLNRRLHAGSLSYDALTHSEKAVRVLEKFQARTDLTGAERAAVDWRIQSLHAEVELERAKRAVANGDFEAAAGALKDANEFYRSWKLRIVGCLLRLSPKMIARAHQVRERRRMERSPQGE
jgi:glycosyltransferase involved in cell wall biosynthesis